MPSHFLPKFYSTNSTEKLYCVSQIPNGSTAEAEFQCHCSHTWTKAFYWLSPGRSSEHRAEPLGNRLSAALASGSEELERGDGSLRDLRGVTAVLQCPSPGRGRVSPAHPAFAGSSRGMGARPGPAAPGRAPPPGSRSPLTDDVVPGGAHLVQVDVCAGEALGVHQRLVHPDALLL